MRGVAKAVLGVILSSVAILLLLNLAFFFSLVSDADL